MKDKRGISAKGVALLVIIVVAIIAVVGGYFYFSSFYSIGAGKVGIITDQVGGVVRIEKGPVGWAPKAYWETVKYYNIMVQTEDMISPSEEVNGTVIVHPAPLGDLRYGAVPVNTKDVPNIYLDVSVQWHIDSERDGWKDRIVTLYLQYPGKDYETKTVLPGARDALRNFAGRYTCDELAHTKVEESSLEVTAYVQSFINNITTLDESIIIDKVFIRRRIPPVRVQKAYLEAKAAIEEAKAILTLADAARNATIRIAEGQRIAIELVVNATEASVSRLVAQNLTATEAINYLGLQYTFDSLKKIAEKFPEWKLTIFINAPEPVYTIPIESGD